MSLRASVVVVSRDRPHHLRRCLRALGQLGHDAVEIVVVADAAGLDMARQCAPGFVLVPCDVANIAIARNLGIEAAGGEIIAFVDDDAIAEPGWLYHLAAAFALDGVDAVGGIVLGPDGIRTETGAQIIGPAGLPRALAAEPLAAAFVPAAPAGWAVSTIGTNCAFRRSVFDRIGMFDPAYAYYLEDSDLDLRMAAAGMRIAIAPRAVVHHAAAASASRGPGRRIADLFQIGVSTAVHLRKHAAPANFETLAARNRAHQRRRLMRQMVSGLLEPGAVEPLLARLDAGLAEGRLRPLASPPRPRKDSRNYHPLIRNSAYPEPVTVSGHLFFAQILRARAAKAAAQGKLVTLCLFTRLPISRKITYDSEGYWIHRIGPPASGLLHLPHFGFNSPLNWIKEAMDSVVTQRHPWQVRNSASDLNGSWR